VIAEAMPLDPVKHHRPEPPRVSLSAAKAHAWPSCPKCLGEGWRWALAVDDLEMVRALCEACASVRRTGGVAP
jgi:hypothetical protein